MHNVHVSCDKDGCGWIIPCVQDDIPTWHNKPCPKCGKGVIVNDKELALFKLIVAAQSKTPEGCVEVHFDTSKCADTKSSNAG